MVAVKNAQKNTTPAKHRNRRGNSGTASTTAGTADNGDSSNAKAQPPDDAAIPVPTARPEAGEAGGEKQTEVVSGGEVTKKPKPPKLPEWAIGTRVVCHEFGTFARVEARISNRIALRWEHGDKGGGTYTTEDLRDKRIVRAAVQNPDEVAIAPPANTHKLTANKSSAFAEAYEAEAQELEAKINPSPLSDLATQINQLHTDCEQALEIVQSAQQAALQHAKRCGELLLEAKQQCGHGGWEKWRSDNLKLPSSTASLYQRVAKNWEKLEAAGVEGLTLRDADRLLRKSKELPEDKSPTVVDLTPPTHDNAVINTREGLERLLGDSSEVGNSKPTREIVPLDQIETIAPSGWIQTKDGESLNPRHYQAEQEPASSTSTQTLTQLDNAILGLSEVHYAVRKFAALNERNWNEATVDEVAAAVLGFLAEY